MSEGGDALLCSMCEAYAPICPMCCAIQGGHKPRCEVADGYTDCGDGPWDAEQDALDFAHAEVGVAWDVVRVNHKWYVLTKAE